MKRRLPVIIFFLGLAAALPGCLEAEKKAPPDLEDARRLEFHRRIAECSSEAEIQALEAETADRFGAAPEALRRLFAVARCRILAAERGIGRVELDDAGTLFLFRDGRACRTRSGALPRPAGRTPDERLACIAAIIRTM